MPCQLPKRCANCNRRWNPLPDIVFIDGVPGAGKSSLLRQLKSSGYYIIEEPVSKWTLFKKYQKDKGRFMFSFQMQVLKTMLQEIKNIDEMQKKRPIFIERSFRSSLVFSKVALNKGLIEQEEHDLLGELVKDYESKLEGFWRQTIFLSCKNETCHERVKKRARENECLSFDDIKELAREYENLKDESSVTLSSNGTIYGLENMLLNELNL